MTRQHQGVLFAVIAVLAVSGCNLQAGSPAGEDGSAEDANTLTAIHQIQSAGETAVMLSAAATPSNTPALGLPTGTPSPSLSATPGKVTVTVSKNTNCRTGPDKQFDLVGIMAVGETAEAIGRNADRTYWIIQLPSKPAKTCWLWSEWATTTGDGQALPVLESPPTPTWFPRPDFSLANIGVHSCGSNYFLTVELENTGNVALESVLVTVEDITQGETTENPSDTFRWIDGCALGADLPSLAPGSKAKVSTLSFLYDPAGHNIHTIVKACTGNGMAGICQQSDFYLAV